jgi:glycosyltransferase involved in cell wall biosynthesis
VMRKPTVITYHCDLQMPPGMLNQLANVAVNMMNHLAGNFTHKIVTYTRDYAENSPYLSLYSRKLHIIHPPVELPPAKREDIERFALEIGLKDHGPKVGMAARFAAEKGVEVLLEAFPEILKQHPKATVLFAGPYKNIIGEEEYAARLFPIISKYEEQGNWKFMGELDPTRMAAFYPNLDVLVIPSLNSTEAFGLVQIEAMINGVPVVASNLPGVRQPVAMTSMGKVAPIGDPAGLAEAVLEVLANREKYKRDTGEIRRRFTPESVAREYERIFTMLSRKKVQKVESLPPVSD